MPTAQSLCVASAACSAEEACRTTDSSGSSTNPAFVPKEPPESGTLIAPGRCPAACSSKSRTSSTVASPGAASSAESGGRGTHGPRLSATTRAVVGGFGAETDEETSTKSWTSRNPSEGFVSRSRPIVDDRSLLMLPPHSDPATWPG